MLYTLTTHFLSMKPYDMLKVKDNGKTERRNKNGIPKRNFKDPTGTAVDTNLSSFNGTIQQRRNQNMISLCDLDHKKCFAKSCICRRNKASGFQTNYDYANPQQRIPFRNGECSHFKKNRSEPSGYEKVKPRI